MKDKLPTPDELKEATATTPSDLDAYWEVLGQYRALYSRMEAAEAKAFRQGIEHQQVLHRAADDTWKPMVKQQADRIRVLTELLRDTWQMWKPDRMYSGDKNLEARIKAALEGKSEA